MTRPAHPPATIPVPVCPGCGRPMQYNGGLAQMWVCDHTGIIRSAYDLPRGDDTATPNHQPRPSSGPFALPPDRGPRPIHHQGSIRGRRK